MTPSRGEFHLYYSMKKGDADIVLQHSVVMQASARARQKKEERARPHSAVGKAAPLSSSCSIKATTEGGISFLS